MILSDKFEEALQRFINENIRDLWIQDEKDLFPFLEDKDFEVIP
jgi:hypothetical protein